MKKIFFSSSFTFLKLDADDDILNLKVKWQHHLFINSINLITAETKNIYASLNKMYTLQKEVAYLPNGFYGNGLKKDVDYGSKENLIITVGRIGTFQKNNEILLEAFREFALLNTTWRLEIIGPIEKDFEPYITQYFKLNPFLKDRVLFTGSITDRIQLEDKYTKAKIFVLTSRFESFGLVYLEAMKSACIIISTAITPAYDITDNGRFGSLFPIGDFKSLAALLLQTVNDSQKLEEDCKLIQDFAYENFTWTKICQGLNKLIH
jgi:glycosyltransferase involved in cell wall biosynthesis